MPQEKFHYKSLEEVKQRAAELGVDLPFAADTHALAQPLTVRNITFPNRLGIAPMEGADSTPEGAPTEYTTRRYVNEAIGGSSVIWFEAISIVEEGRSSQTQLLLNRDTLDEFKKMTAAVKEAGLKANGYEQYRAADDSCIVTDDYLKGLEEKFGEAAALAKEAGFDAVDIKSCHGYLLAELASAYNRPGEYGGSFENRFRLLKNGIRAAKVYEDDSFMVTARIGIYDGYAYPWGFGVSPESGMTPDLTEPIRLVRDLHNELGLNMVNLTMGNPYATTHVTRPFDFGKYEPDEHPFVGLSRMIHGIGAVKKAVPEMTVWASAPTYLRAYADLFSAGAVEQGLCDGMLFGRMAFADPDFANEIVKNGRIDPKRVCLTCGKCGDLIRAHKPTGCVIRDSKTFMPFYKEFLEIKKTQPANFRG